MRYHSAIPVFLYISKTWESPVPVYSISNQDKTQDNIPDVFTKLFDTIHQLNPQDNITSSLTELKTRISSIALGKTTPIQNLTTALTTLSTLPYPPTSKPLDRALTLARNNLVPTNILDILQEQTNNPINSINNTNPIPPNPPIYPNKHPTDAPYSLPESALRSAIHIPKTFTYDTANKTPILLVPGTGSPAGSTYQFSFTKLFSQHAHTDPVWVNIPGNSLDDIQSNAEYVAYAINYISAVSKRAIGVVSWSQGGIDVQWALKYWPSTRASVTDFMAISADFHGTVMDVLCAVPSLFCTPAIAQQGYRARLVGALRGEGGDSAYVSTTSVYSGFDAVVQPQSGGEWASGFLGDERGVGVENVLVQDVCRGMEGGGYYSHSSVLVHPLAFALFVDALEHDGPGRVERVDLEVVCGMSLAPGLGLGDFLGTEVMGDIVGPLNTLLFRHGSNIEPALRGYASK
ncbi:uncharacterized protein N7511_006598 [Penicillium nucicola]|uniref:uncharacterized protein n=1 Tax=Penicillium nucicola TaxID=1850975 RepID=UPI0025459E62|nr:uncharacterized protein N7511_006598 [Penicillium nucicola]KAJ5757904.1 hypothetical protein N7511_006598 [Penicillium nucicola]